MQSSPLVIAFRAVVNEFLQHSHSLGFNMALMEWQIVFAHLLNEVLYESGFKFLEELKTVVESCKLNEAVAPFISSVKITMEVFLLYRVESALE
jgi:hypothetical protein